MSIQLVNLTSHKVNIEIDGVSVPLKRAPFNQIARVVKDVLSQEYIDTEAGRILLNRYTNCRVENLPEPKDNTLYIVSMQVILMVSGRKDIVHPDGLIRNHDRMVDGCKSLSIIVDKRVQ